MDRQGTVRIKQLLSDGRDLFRANSAVHAHADFEIWVNGVHKWLERWGSLSDVAKWSTLPYSVLVRASEYSNEPVTWAQFRRDVRERFDWLSNKLQIIEATTHTVIDRANDAPRNNKVFVIHGRDIEARESVARFLDRAGFQPIILNEQANLGRTIIEKVEAYSDVGFAVVLLTPDELGYTEGGTPEPRVGQNVLLELGYFIGLLKRRNVCALKRGHVEIPSDFAGIVWETMDAGNGWKQTLGRELQAAGYEIDWNVVMR